MLNVRPIGGGIFRFGPRVVDQRPRVEAVTPVTKVGQDKALLKQLHVDVAKLRKSLSGLAGTLRPKVPKVDTTTTTTEPATVVGGAVALDVVGSDTTRESTEEVNATKTSFSPFGPDWTEDSTALATVEGVYKKGYGDDELSFKVLDNGTIGEDKIRVRVIRKNGETLQTITIQNSHDPGRKYSLKNGLKVSFGEGELSKNDSFGVDTYSKVGSVVDADKVFDGLRNDNPNLQYGYKVTAGTLEINGTAINVAADDSLNSVLQKITESEAGVTAEFDVATEKVKLTATESGEDGRIEFGDDDSGFLKAAKLKHSQEDRGEDSDLDDVVRTVGPLKKIRSGTITINGEQITISRSRDSLNDIMARINASDAGVTASFDAETLKFKLVSNDPEKTMVIQDGNTRLFDVLNVVEGSHEPSEVEEAGGNSKEARKRALRLARKTERSLLEVQAHMRRITQKLDDLGTENPHGKRIRDQLQTAVDLTVGGEASPLRRNVFGLDFDLRAGSGDDVGGVQVRRGRGGFVHNLVTKRAQVKAFLLGGRGDTRNEGFIKNMDASLKAIEGSLSMFGRSGLELDAFI